MVRSAATPRVSNHEAMGYAVIPGKPTSHKERASLMEADYDRPTTVVKASG
jgi:alpha-D-ribose 1-methylphosphonate 5-triphosphate synthase subunit PhnG